MMMFFVERVRNKSMEKNPVLGLNHSWIPMDLFLTLSTKKTSSSLDTIKNVLLNHLDAINMGIFIPTTQLLSPCSPKHTNLTTTPLDKRLGFINRGCLPVYWNSPICLLHVAVTFCYQSEGMCNYKLERIRTGNFSVKLQ